MEPSISSKQLLKQSTNRTIRLWKKDAANASQHFTAAGCGSTPQYDELQDIYDAFKDRGLEILDFPCNQRAAKVPESCASLSEIHNRIVEDMDRQVKGLRNLI